MMLIFILIPFWAQLQSIKFQNLSLDQGLSQSSVLDITQDKLGYIWIATQDGLNRYDGYQFKAYRHDFEDTNSLSSNYITSVLQDQDSNWLWIGTETGVNVFDYKKNKICLIKHPSLEHQEISEITQDSDKNIWVGTNNGLYQIKGKEVEKYYPQQKQINTICWMFDQLIIGTNKGLFAFNPENEKLQQLSLNELIISDIQQMNNELLIASSEGVMSLNSTLQLDKIKYKRLDFETKTLFVNNQYVWIGTEDNGLIQYNIATKIYSQYEHEENDRFSLANNLIHTVYKDHSGVFWVGTDNGISKFDPSKQFFGHVKYSQHKKSLLDPIIWSIVSDNNENTWVGSRQGITKLDHKSKVVYNIPYQAKNPESPNNNSIYSLLVNQDQKLLVGASDGLYQLQILDSNQFVFKDLLKGRVSINTKTIKVFSLYEDGHTLWIGTNQGLIILNDQLSLILKSSGSAKFKIPDNEVRAIAKDKSGNFWVGTEGGLAKIKFQNDSIHAIQIFQNDPSNPKTLSNNVITNLLIDKNDNLWISTYGGGINKFIPASKTFQKFTTQNGLANNSTYGMLEDDGGNIWISTNYGISKLDTKTFKFTTYHEKDGLQSNEFNIGAFAKAKSGKLFFGGINGVSFFNPFEIKKNTTSPKVIITDIIVNNKEIKPNKNGVLEKNISLTSHLELNYKQINFTIKFASLHYANSSNNKYRFYLKGFEDSTAFTTSNTFAQYTNLNPGEYTFVVYGSNSDGTWSEKPAALSITITPPFWRTWPFRLIVIGALILFVLSFIRARMYNIKLQNSRLEKKVEARTSTIVAQSEKIEAQKKIH